MTTTGRRPTPGDPMPGTTPMDRVPSATVRKLPPDCGPDPIAIIYGPTFMYSDAKGDVLKSTTGGLVHNDTRFLNQWELTVEGAYLHVLRSCAVDSYSAAFFLTNADVPGLSANSIGVRRQRFVVDGLHERIEVHCFGPEPASIELRLAVGADFADILEVKERIRDRSAEIVRDHHGDGSRLSFCYRNRGFEAITEVEVSNPADRVDGDTLVWYLQLLPRDQWRCEFTVPLSHGGVSVRPVRREFGEVFDRQSGDAAYWRAHAPDLREGPDALRAAFDRSVEDLVAMRIEKRCRGRSIVLPAAGLPWFVAIFGRDALIAAYEGVGFGQTVAHGALLTLADQQGTKVDDFSDEEPGRILHEIRSGELTQLGIKPYNPYYGTADATQLWLIVLSEYWRWTGDDRLVTQLRENAYAALRWIDEYGDRDRDGYVEYATRSAQGLGNQCWRDSWDGIQFADGGIPFLPIATCEIQGYTYDAKLRLAELCAGPYRDPELAARLREQAAALRERFNRDFWIENERGGYYAVGLDGDKRQIDSMTSNMGHLLWSGIVPPDRAATVARQLMSEEMFSGWGVRTTSTKDEGYNPIGYHMGTVWPHDNALIAYGLARYGFRDEANRIVTSMLEASGHSGNRLPEAFAGYDRGFARMPVPYPAACSPQTWASATPLLFIRTMLGLEPVDGRLVADPRIPERFGRISIARLRALGRGWNVDAVGDQAEIRPVADAASEVEQRFMWGPRD